MKENRATVLGWIGLSEGGYVNNPKDPGGPTDRGITQKTFDAHNRSKGLPVRPVRGISKELADEIIVENYMTPIRFDDLPAGLDYSVADFAVNSGVKRAAIELQRIVGVKADGVIGDLTLEAIETFRTLELIQEYNRRRLAYVRGLSTFKTFGKGWTIRIDGAKTGVQADDIGVVDRSWRLANSAIKGEPIEVKQASATPIPGPVAAAPGRARDEDMSAGSILGKVLSDPVAAIPAIATAVTPLASGLGPVQWALAAVIVLAGLYALSRALRRSL